MTLTLTETKQKCVDLLTFRRGDERYRSWAEGAVDRFVCRYGADSIQSRASELLERLQSEQQVLLVMSGGDFFPPQMIKV